MRPDNIVLTPQGVAYLTNLSLAHAPDTPDLSSIDEADFLTAYSAPEQTLVGGEMRRESDLYSLGAVLYQMASGELPPPPGQSIPPLASRDPSLSSADRVIRKLLATDPAQRFNTADQAAAALRQSLRKQIDDSTDDMEESRWEPIAEWLENPVETVIGELIDQEFPGANPRPRRRPTSHWRSTAHARPLEPPGGACAAQRWAMPFSPSRLSATTCTPSSCSVQYETRTQPQKREMVHKTGAVNPAAAETELWNIAVPEVEPFMNAPAEPIVIPGSQRVVACTECNGSAQVQCKTCTGKGVIEKNRRVKEADGSTRTESYAENCPTCRGYGKLPCPRCEGTGQMLEEQIFTWSRHGRVFFNEDDVAAVPEAGGANAGPGSVSPHARCVRAALVPDRAAQGVARSGNHRWRARCAPDCRRSDRQGRASYRGRLPAQGQAA